MDILDYSNEEWRPVVGWEAEYEVSSMGRVKSMRRGRLRKLKLNKFGYPVTILYREGQGKDVFVHGLMAEAFICPRPEGLVVNHRDGVKTHNIISNLEWTTHSGNRLHAFAMGLVLKGKDHPRNTKPERWANSVWPKRPKRQGAGNYNATLTNAQACKIRELRLSGLSYSKIQTQLGCSKSTVANIVNGRTYTNALLPSIVPSI